MNEIDSTVAAIKFPIRHDRPTNSYYDADGRLLHGFQIESVANAYTKAVADNEKLRACVEHYAAQKDMTVRCGACGFENHRRANRDRAQQTLDAIGKE